MTAMTATNIEPAFQRGCGICLGGSLGRGGATCSMTLPESCIHSATGLVSEWPGEHPQVYRVSIFGRYYAVAARASTGWNLMNLMSPSECGANPSKRPRAAVLR